MIDLHSHSTASDGSYSPTELVHLAVESGLSALALTDHDTVGGIPEAESTAGARGLRIIRGVEVEIAFEPGEFHLLGLGLERLDGELGEALDRLGRSRDERNARILERLGEAGMELSMDELRETAGAGRIGRPHIAGLLVKNKAVRTRQEAFDRFLGKGRPFYESKDCLELAEALRMIRAAGGRVIVAHPLSLFVSWGHLASIMDEWKELGIDGIEAYHPTAKLSQCRRLERMGRERGFMISAGSDFHGAIRPDRRLGRTAGGLPIDDAYLAQLNL
ncbi:MAG TPA: PHP domain-containing protein [Rectinemataceae bacterium]|nr:PHP domain-containing protein [Rectinemataceae bacterium]